METRTLTAISKNYFNELIFELIFNLGLDDYFVSSELRLGET